LKRIGEGFEVHDFKTSCLVDSISELQTRRAARRLSGLLAAV